MVDLETSRVLPLVTQILGVDMASVYVSTILPLPYVSINKEIDIAEQ